MSRFLRLIAIIFIVLILFSGCVPLPVEYQPIVPVGYDASLAPSHAGLLAASEPQPEVYDLNGLPRDLAWLRSNYGNVYVDDAGLPRFTLERIDVTNGPATIVVRVVSKEGYPVVGQPVILTWPGQQCGKDHPDPNIKEIPTQYLTHTPCGIIQKTNESGVTGFGMSTDWYYHGQDAPGIIYIGSISTNSQIVHNIGMLGGTVHEGPLHLTFQEETSCPPTPTPV